MPPVKDSVFAIFSQPAQVNHRRPEVAERSFGDKVVSHPNSIPSFTKRPSSSLSRTIQSTVFEPPAAITERQAHANQNHTNPFCPDRQGANEPPRVRKTPEFFHPEPKPTGMKHVEPNHKPVSVSIISPTGAISGGGRKHVTGLPDHPSMLRRASKRIVGNSSMTSSDSFELAVVAPRSEGTANQLLFGGAVPEPNSRVKKQFEQGCPQSLRGVMEWNKHFDPMGFSYCPPWHRGTPQETTPRPTSIVSSRVKRVPSAALTRAGEETTLPKPRKHLGPSSSLQPPWYVDVE